MAAGIAAISSWSTARTARSRIFFNNSASAVDLEVPIVMDGVDYGAPLANLKKAMRDAGLTSVDLWIGRGRHAGRAARLASTQAARIHAGALG